VISNSNTSAYLLCRIVSRVCAIPTAHVSETMRPLPLEPLAGAPSFVLGIAIIRGAPTPVVDTAALLGSSGAAPTRFVTINTGDGAVALAVDAVLGVTQLAPEALPGVSPLLREANPDVVASIASLDTALLLVLELSRVLADSTWAAVHAHGASR
jgi:purine-binding chemotaxis protein CheW